jgi:hypothetical protein
MTWPISNEGNYSEINKIPISTLFRWFLYDVNSDEAPKYASLFNLTPVSEEGNLKEQEDSDIRLENLAELLPLFDFYSDATSEFSFKLHKDKLTKLDGVTDDMINASEEAFKEFYYKIAFAGILSSFSALVELKIIKLNSTHTSIEEGEL